MSADGGAADGGGASAGGSAVAGGGASAGGSASVGAVLPTTLNQSPGWNASLTLMSLVVALVLMLIFAPALAWRYFSNKSTA